MNINQINFLELLKTNENYILLAPSFPIDFKYPNIIGMLKKIGADKITELTFGAKIVNETYLEYIKNNPNQRYFITSPCPTIVSLIKTQYKELVQYLMPVVSPLIAQAKIIKKSFPNKNIIFISPCKSKQLIETKEFKDIVAETITFKELREIFNLNNIKEEEFDNIKNAFASLILSSTKIYPISGGLAVSSGINKYFNENEIYINEGIQNIKNILDEIKNGTTTYRFFDILNCEGGCIGGPELFNKEMSLDVKKEKILEYKENMKKECNESHIQNHTEQIENINFSRNF